MKQKDIVTSYRMYALWEYEREEQQLNEASRKGLQLIKGGCFHSKFKKETDVRYIYQIDYNPSIKDRDRYAETFEEQGWNYINSTFNGWHYFRKKYEEGMEESECKIYTDKQSLYEMQNKWIRLLCVLGIIMALFTVIYIPMGYVEKQPLLFAEGLIFFVMTLTFLLAFRDVRRKRKGKETGFLLPYQIIFTGVVFLLLVLFVLALIM